MEIELYDGGQKVFTTETVDSITVHDNFITITYKENKKTKRLDSNLPYIIYYDK